MLISNTHDFIFIHTGKTGGMSMRAILQPYAEEPAKFKMHRPPKMVGDRPNPMYSVWETLLLHAKARDVQKEFPEEVFNKCYKFAFVRNPWDLQVSMYHFLLRETAAPRHEQVKALGSFEAFVDWVIVTPDPYPRGITKLQSEMITDCQGTPLMDFVGRYEALSEDFAHVCKTLGIEAALPHLNQSRHDDYRGYYDRRTQELIGECFKSDIELLGYTFDGARAKGVAV